MTKAEAVGMVLTKVLGGALNENSDVIPADIGPYLSAVIDYAIKLDLEERRQRKRLDRALFIQLSERLDEDLLCTYTLSPTYDKKRGEHYVVLPVSIASTFGNSGLDYSGPINVEASSYIKVGSRAQLSGIISIAGGTTFYYYEKDGESSEQKVYYVNMGYPVCDVLVRILVSVTDLDDDAVLPIPQGYEKMVIDWTVEFFMEQRMTPSGNTNWVTDKDTMGNE